MGDMEAVEEFLREMSAPPRRRPVPRIAEPLRGLDIEEVQGPQGKIAAWRIGEGPAVLLVHGYEDDNALWTPMLDALSARGRAVVVFDLPAHGLSDGADGSSGGATDAIFAVTRALGPIDALIGHSLGGFASALALDEGHQAQRLVAMGAPFDTAAERWRRMARRMGFGDDVADHALALAHARHGPPRGRELPQLIQALKTPALVIHSRADAVCPFLPAETACAGCANAHLIALEDANHRETAQHAEAIAAAVLFCD